MENESKEKGFIEKRIEDCEEVEQQLAIPNFNNWLKDVGLWNIEHKNAWSKIHFMEHELNLYNEVHKYIFYLHNNKVVRFWFINSSGGVNFREISIEEFLKQQEYDFKFTHYMHLFLSIFTLGLYRCIIPWLIKHQERRNRDKIEKLKYKIKTWEPGKS